MTAVAEASTLIRAAAEPAQVGESVKAALRRAARRVGISAGLAKRLWYGEVRRVDAELMDRLRAASRVDAHELELARDEFRTALARLEQCEAALGLSAAHHARPMGAQAR